MTKSEIMLRSIFKTFLILSLGVGLGYAWAWMALVG